MTRRTFLALPLQVFQREIKETLDRIRPQVEGVKWVNPKQAHVTLHFFGPVTDNQLASIKKIVSPVAKIFPPLHLALSDFGFFPNPRLPRIIWLGLSGNTLLLQQMQARLEDDFRESGFPIEDRAFKAHATLGRMKLDPKKTKVHAPFEFRFEKSTVQIIDTIILYESRLTSEGPLYEALETFSLSGTSA